MPGVLQAVTPFPPEHLLGREPNVLGEDAEALPWGSPGAGQGKGTHFGRQRTPKSTRRGGGSEEEEACSGSSQVEKRGKASGAGRVDTTPGLQGCRVQGSLGPLLPHRAVPHPHPAHLFQGVCRPLNDLREVLVIFSDDVFHHVCRRGEVRKASGLSRRPQSCGLSVSPAEGGTVRAHQPRPDIWEHLMGAGAQGRTGGGERAELRDGAQLST